MQKHSSDKIAQLKTLRKKGYSISQLVKKFAIPKSTVWHHVHNIKLSRKSVALIKSRQGGSKIRSQNEWQKANNHAQTILQNDTKYPCSLAAMLYWAEGNKKDFVFTNTDGRMIRLYLFILKKYFLIEDERIKLTLRIFSNLNKNQCLKYWSKIANLPKSRFSIYLNDGGTKGKAQYGICRMTVKKGGYLNKLTTALINNIVGEIVDTNTQNGPGSSAD